MKTKEMTNQEIVDIMKFMEGSIKDKKLPIKLSYAIRRSMVDIKNAYNIYIEALNDICDNYGCSINDFSINEDNENIKKEKEKQLNKDIRELLCIKTFVNLYTINLSLVEECGTGPYDKLTYNDIDGLWWIIDDSPKGDEIQKGEPVAVEAESNVLG